MAFGELLVSSVTFLWHARTMVSHGGADPFPGWPGLPGPFGEQASCSSRLGLTGELVSRGGREPLGSLRGGTSRAETSEPCWGTQPLLGSPLSGQRPAVPPPQVRL